MTLVRLLGVAALGWVAGALVTWWGFVLAGVFRRVQVQIRARGEVADASDPASQACALTVPLPTTITDLDWLTFETHAHADHLLWRWSGGCGDTPAHTFPDWSIR